MLKTILALIILFLLFQSATCAEYYKWEDENGNINITDYPPPAKSKKTVKVYQSEQESIEIAPSEPAQPQTKAASSQAKDVKQRKSNDVVLYTTGWCPYCKKAKEFFKSRNINISNYDIEQDRDAAERKKQLDPRGGVPFAIINGQKIHGFSPDEYERALQ
jgi:glutaredoxin